MKKSLLTAIFAVFLLLAIAVPAMAYQNFDLYIDNVKVPTVPNICYGEKGETEGTYYMDAQPQLKDGRAYVPVKVISQYLGADIAWQRPNILIAYGDTSLTLTLGSKTAVKNDAQLTLDAAPYAKNGRTMVPIRFIAEAFGCRVGYANAKVYINTAPLYIDGKKVVSAQNWTRMTMGGFLDECKTNVCINRLYQFLLDSEGEETAVPEYYGEMFNMDVPYFYYMLNEISFMESAGVDGTDIQKFKIYQRMNDYGEILEWEPKGTDLGEWLIYDVTHGKWYKLALTDYNKDFSDITSIGDWVQILNNVA